MWGDVKRPASAQQFSLVPQMCDYRACCWLALQQVVLVEIGSGDQHASGVSDGADSRRFETLNRVWGLHAARPVDAGELLARVERASQSPGPPENGDC